MVRPRAWIRLFSYAAIGVGAGYLLQVFTGVVKELAALFACAVIAGLFLLHRRRDNSAHLSPSTDAEGAGVASDEEFLRERWKQDLDYEAAGVSSPAVPSSDWGPGSRDMSHEELDRTERD